MLSVVRRLAPAQTGEREGRHAGTPEAQKAETAEDTAMYLDVESIVTLNAMRRAEIHQEIVGIHGVRYPWAERAETHQARAAWRPIRALRAAVASLHRSAPVQQPTS